MIKLWSEFKKFALRSNVMDLAVAVVIGNAVNILVKSLVADILTPILGIFIGRIDISSLSFKINSRLIGEKALTINYGDFLQSLLNFLTLTFCIFLMLKAVNKIYRLSFFKKDSEEEEKEPEPPSTEQLLIEIRDLLKEQALPAGQPTQLNNDASNSPDGFDKEH